MTRDATNILKHVRAMRRELEDPLTPRRKFPALVARLQKRLDQIEALCRGEYASTVTLEREWLEAPASNPPALAGELEPTDADRALLLRAFAVRLLVVHEGRDEVAAAAIVDSLETEAEHSAALDTPAPDEEGARTVNRSVPP